MKVLRPIEVIAFFLSLMLAKVVVVCIVNNVTMLFCTYLNRERFNNAKLDKSADFELLN